MSLKSKLFLAAAAIFLIHAALHIYLLPSYGLSWDEPNHYMRGQIFLRFFLTGKKNYSEMPKLQSHYVNNDYAHIPSDALYKDDSQYRRSLYQYDQEPDKFTFTFYTQDKGEAGHPPLSDIFAAFSNYVFYQKLGWFGDIESYHIFIVFVSSILVASIFWFVASFYGIFAGLVAALSLSLYPLFFAELHFNVKDPPQATFYSLALMSFFVAVTRKKVRWLIFSAIFAGIALATKFNIFFGILTAFIWLTLYCWKKLRKLRWPFPQSFSLGLLAFPFISLTILFASWPFLWGDPIGKLRKVFGFYELIGGMTYQSTTIFLHVFNTYAAEWILYSSPIITLFLFALGLWYVFREGSEERSKLALFIFLWVMIPVVRVSIAGTGIYGGLRQVLEFLPAMAMLAGIGATLFVRLGARWLATWGRLSKKAATLAAQGFVVLLFLPITLKIITIHPNQNVYFNPFIGGLKGASTRNFPDWGITLGSVYKQGVDYLNQHAERGAKLALIKGFLSNVPLTSLRSDIHFGNFYYSGSAKQGEYIMEVIDYYWQRDIPEEKRHYLKALIPVYEVKVDGTTILAVWKNDSEHTRITGSQ